MQPNVVRRECSAERGRSHHLNTLSIDAANVFSIFGLIFGSVMTYQILSSQLASANNVHATLDEPTHVQTASSLSE